MKKSLLVAIISFMIVGFTSCGNENSRQQRFDSEVKMANAACPMVLDDYTVIEKIEGAPNYTIKYCAKIKELDPSLFADVDKDELKENLLSSLKSHAGFNMLKEFDYSYLYEYRHENGELLYEILITPEDYK